MGKLRQYVGHGIFAATAMCSSAMLSAEITIATTQDLAFGQFVAGLGGTVAVSTTGAVTSTGDVFPIPSSSGLAAQFLIGGNVDATYSIQLPADGAVNLIGPGANMALTDFVSNPTVGAGGLLTGGSQVLLVGATLNVNSGQVSGAYTGDFTVTVIYD